MADDIKEKIKEKIKKKINDNPEQDNRRFKKRYVTISVFVVIVILGTYFLWNSTRYQSTDDAYVEGHLVQIAPRVEGQVEEIHITDNQKVKEGDVVAVIDSSNYKIKFNQADAQYQKALLNQNVAVANLDAVNSEINLARIDLERYKNLYEKGAVSKQMLDTAQTKYDSVMAKHTNAENMIFSNNSSKVADADLKTLKAQRDQAELNLGYTRITAPRDGIVTNKNVEKGAYVRVGQPLFALASENVWIVANFKENQVGKMKPGQNVDIKIDAYPHKVFKGKIDSIQRASGAKASLFPPENAVGSFVKIVQRIPVKIVFTEEIDREQYNVVAGMSVVPRVKVK